MADNQRAKHGTQQPHGNRDSQKQGGQQGDQHQGPQSDRARGQENPTDNKRTQSGQKQSGDR